MQRAQRLETELKARNKLLDLRANVGVAEIIKTEFVKMMKNK